MSISPETLYKSKKLTYLCVNFKEIKYNLNDIIVVRLCQRDKSLPCDGKIVTDKKGRIINSNFKLKLEYGEGSR